MRKVLAGTLLVVALAFVLAGCGGSASSTTNTNGTTAPRHASNGEASKSARQVLADAVKSTAKATFMRINGNVTSSGKKFGLNFLISQNGDGSKGILYPSGQAVGLIVIGKNAYIKAEPPFWKEFGGSPGEQLGKALNGRWLQFPTHSAQFAPLVAFASPQWIFSPLKSNVATLKNTGTTTFNHQAAVALDGGAEGTLYVAASGIPYPVGVVKKGKDGGTVYFTAWNQPFAITAPTGAVTLSQLGR
jgi:hypothetical protein